METARIHGDFCRVMKIQPIQGEPKWGPGVWTNKIENPLFDRDLGTGIRFGLQPLNGSINEEADTLEEPDAGGAEMVLNGFGGAATGVRVGLFVGQSFSLSSGLRSRFRGLGRRRRAG